MYTTKRLFDYLYEQQENHPIDRAFGHRNANSAWEYYSTAQMVQTVEALCRGLRHLGLQQGDKVATVIYKTSPEWVALDYAMLRMGIINVPMYPTISTREYAYILQESGALYCFVGEGDLYDKVSSARQQTPQLRDIYTFYDHMDAPHYNSLLLPTDTDADSELAQIAQSIKPTDIATIIYTSGTTGNPKGVVLTHRSIVFNVETMRALLPVNPGDKGLSFLPVSHVFERAVVYAYTAYGVSVSFTTPDRLGGDEGDLKLIQPHFFTAVPRLLEKVYEKIYSKALTLKGIKRAAFFWAMGLAEHWDFDQSPSGITAFKWKIADLLVFSKWREALGGNIKGIVVGASACPVHIMRTFNAAGIRVREGYGMTELSPAASFNRFESGGAMLGTVGQVIAGVTVRIETSPDLKPDEGEILVKGDGVMEGYYLQPEKTAEVIREMDGARWMCTGDVGKLVTAPNGHVFLQITDRKKELLKTSGGKYIAPTPIESALKGHRLVEQAMVVGDNLKFVSVLIVPAVDGLKDWCAKHQIPWSTLSAMLDQPRVKERYQMLIDRINTSLGQFEQLKKFTLIADTWEGARTDGTEAELTPSLKLKRRVIMEKYKGQIAAMYAG